MARYTAAEVYELCLSVGFTPDQAVTMTAIAGAESGWNIGAANTSGENSRGFWQINWDAHAGAAWAQALTADDLHDPRINALAAWHVSKGGADIRPWTVTHTDKAGSYPHYAEDRFRLPALEAARSHGHATAQGNFDGPANYRDAAVPASASGVPPAMEGPADVPMQGGVVDGAETPGDVFLRHALAQSGDAYVFGAEATTTDADPDAFDCSELVQWAAAQAGLDVPDGSYNQYLWAKDQGWVVPVEEAIDTPGALLFRFGSEPVPGGGRPSGAHVAISIGDGTTIEARGRAYGVGEFEAEGRFAYAVVIPELAGGIADEGLVEAAWHIDTDADGLMDAEEEQFGGDMAEADTDGDGVGDFDEARLGANLRSGDSDLDSRSDVRELFEGTDLTVADTDIEVDVDVRGGASPGYGSRYATGVDADADADGIDDGRELAEFDTDVTTADTDGDGYRDLTEIRFGWDPTVAGRGSAFGGDDGGGGI